MNHNRIIGIGGSAGAIQTLRKILPGFPRNFATPILIVVHLAAQSESMLAEVLGNSAWLQTVTATDPMTAEPGRIYVAPPDRHMVVDTARRVRVFDGPLENCHRPAIDPLFRSMAQVYGAGAVGLILSGNDDDGAAGLAYLRKLGGTALVQDPADANFPCMPESALELVPDAQCVAGDQIAAAVMQFVREPQLDKSATANTMDLANGRERLAQRTRKQVEQDWADAEAMRTIILHNRGSF